MPVLWMVNANETEQNRCTADGRVCGQYDNTNLIFEALGRRNLVAAFEKAKRIIMEWCRFAGLTISHKKSQLVQFSGEPLDNDWCSLDGSSKIEGVVSMNYLGVIIDKRLDWKEHVIKKLENVNNALAWIFRSCRTAYIREKFVLYRSVVVANVTYAAEFCLKHCRSAKTER